MNEDFLHYLWKYKKIEIPNLKTTQQQEIVIKSVGTHNTTNGGPDFFNALLIIDGQKWAGNVEIHHKSNDWYAHHHEKDSAYDNVILHVVWEDDVPVYRKDNSLLPTLQLKDFVPQHLIERYKILFKQNGIHWIACEKQISSIPDFVFSNWKERLFLERIEQKSTLILELLKNTSNNWEAVLFKMLTKSFGLKVNGEAFLSIANAIDFSTIRKCSHDLITLEALLFGQAGLLDNQNEIAYQKRLRKEYDFLKNKFKLNAIGVLPVQFFRLRPINFPTVRLAQLASLYNKNQNLFGDIVRSDSLEKVYKLFEVETSDFWRSHYTFDKQSNQRNKRISKSFIDLLIINTIIPLKFLYAKSQGRDISEEIFEMISDLPSENNSIIKGFKSLNVPVKNGMQSQAMLQLKNKYCDQKACLQCAIGNYLLNHE